MEVGQVNKKIGFIIQARMQSTRLPDKVLMPIPFSKGKPLIKWILDQVNFSKFSNRKVIVATSVNQENNKLENFCTTNNISCFRGDEDNVLSRFINIIKQENFDVVVRLTADNPILDIQLLDKTIEKFLSKKLDYIITKGLPLGMNFEVMCPQALLSLESQKLNDSDKEHVTTQLRSNIKYNASVLKFDEEIEDQENIRLTIDYPSDFLLVSFLLDQLNEDENPGMDLITRVFKENKWVFDANKNNYQKKQFKNDKEEKNAAIEFLKKNDFNNAAKILERNDL